MIITLLPSKEANIDTSITQIQNHSLSWLGTGTYMLPDDDREHRELYTLNIMDKLFKKSLIISKDP